MSLFRNKLGFFLLLAIITLFSFGLRFYHVATAPSGVQVDEASWGYNAYSILQTGKDERGVTYPLIFQAFGDQKLPAYIYSMMPFVKTFGLNNLAVRLPAVIIGTLITLVIFFLLRQFDFSVKLSLLGSLVTAISPWQIILSRIFGYDSNLGLLFFILGLLLLILGYRKNNILFLVLSAIAFGLTWYSYVAYRLISPLILLSGIILFANKRRFINLRSSLISITFLIVILPLVFLSFIKQGTARLNQTTLVPGMGFILNINENRTYCSNVLPKIICYANENKLLTYTYAFISRYIYTFSPDYLFVSGDRDSKLTNVENTGLFPIILFPFYLLGIVYLINRIIEKKITKNELLLIAGLIISPLPAAIVDLPQKVRLTPLFPFLIILLSHGFYQAEIYLKNIASKKMYYLIFALLPIFGLSYVINLLTVHINKYEYVYETYLPKLMTYLHEQDKNTQVYINFTDESILYYAYVNKIDPSIYQKEVVWGKPNSVGITQAVDFQNIHSTKDDAYKIYCESKNKNSLFVTNKDLHETFGEAKKIIMSENSVFKLAFVYDLGKIKTDNINCLQ
jgi:4-amino-4-deoxy-L-arabinose transferase-like glycosyltransferase